MKSGNFILIKVGLNYSIRCFHILGKAFLKKKLSEPSLFLLIDGQNNHPARSVTIALKSLKRQGFFCSGALQPCCC